MHWLDDPTSDVIYDSAGKHVIKLKNEYTG